MDSVILIAKENVNLGTIKKWTKDLDFKESNESLELTDGYQFLNISDCGKGIVGYDEEELKIIKKSIKNPKFFFIDTNNFDLLKKFVLHIKSDSEIIFDNDRGRLFKKHEVLSFNSAEEFYNSTINEKRN